MSADRGGPRFDPLPEGFRVEHEPPRRWWILRIGSPLHADSRAWDAWTRGEGVAPLAVRGGRSLAWLIPLNGGPGVLRHYRRGGLARSLRGDRFWGTRRFLGELHASEILRSRGVASPEILGVYLFRAAGPFFKGWVLSRLVAGGLNLRDWVHQGFSDARERARVIHLCAGGIASMHRAGCQHGDLNLANLLVAGDAIQILDLDGARILPNLQPHDRCENLLRLYRSLAKETGCPEPLSRRERLSFLKAYSRGDGQLFREVALTLSRRWGAARLRRKLSRAYRRPSAPGDREGPGRPTPLPGR